MTKKLILLRHAKSFWGEHGRLSFAGNDHDRPLNKRGRKAAKLMFQHFLERNIEVDVIFSSSAKRATQTLIPFKKKFNYKIQNKLYTFNYYHLLEFLKGIDDKFENVMLICHNPSIQDFCCKYIVNDNNAEFLNLKSKYPTCAASILKSHTSKWSMIEKKGFELEKFIIPKSISD